MTRFSGSRYLLIVTPNLETTIDTVDEELRARYKKQDLVGLVMLGVLSQNVSIKAPSFEQLRR